MNNWEKELDIVLEQSDVSGGGSIKDFIRETLATEKKALIKINNELEEQMEITKKRMKENDEDNYYAGKYRGLAYGFVCIKELLQLKEIEEGK